MTKEASISLLFLLILFSVFFIGNDVRLMHMLVSDSHNGAFENMSALQPWQDFLILAVFVIIALGLWIVSAIALLRKNHKKSLIFSISLFAFYALQFGYWILDPFKLPKG